MLHMYIYVCVMDKSRQVDIHTMTCTYACVMDESKVVDKSNVKKQGTEAGAYMSITQN